MTINAKRMIAIRERILNPNTKGTQNVVLRTIKEEAVVISTMVTEDLSIDCLLDGELMYS